MDKFPFISVVIPTYNRAKMLGITIESFLDQTYPKDKYEIIIADNNSTDNTKEIITGWIENKIVSIRYLFEPRQGVHYARNTAAKLTSGEILYYTDDDMIADRDLLYEIIQPFILDNQVGSVTGRVLPKWEIKPPDWIIQLCSNWLLSLNDQGDSLIISNDNVGVISCHQAMRRNVFFRSGGFNPENTAGEWIGDGETGLNIKIRDLGFKFAYNGKSIIYHMIPPARMTQKYLNKRMANQGNCDSYSAFRKNQYSNFRLYVNIIMYFPEIIKRIVLCSAMLILLNQKWRLQYSYLYYYWKRIKYDYRIITDKCWKELVLKSDWLNI